MNSSDPMTDETGGGHAASGTGSRAMLLSAVTALGIVYGDIGTSPLYAFQVALAATGRPVPSPAEVIGIISLIFWAVILVVTLKYIVIVMRADNEGEGGTLALLSLINAGRRPKRGRIPFIIMLGIAGAAFVYGDGMITPAISVLSAIEGLDVAAPFLKPFVLPLTIAILVGLFSIQARGTGKIGRMFGPVMITWFTTLGVLGVFQIVKTPMILMALNPLNAIEVLGQSGKAILPIIGAAFLALTGAEALYADMGHVGAPAIRRAWFALVLPALLLSYFGQGALVLAHPEAASNPFFNMAPGWATFPLVLLAAMATVIASQAMVTGAFSLTRQAMQMRLLPRMQIKSTSGDAQGQIYLPAINWALMIGAIVVVIAFRTSANLAAAYGIAVSGTMLVTSILLFHVTRYRWKWPLTAAASLSAALAVMDAIFLTANASKFLEGGWLPVVVGGVLAFLMLAWRHGTLEVQHRLEEMSEPFEKFLERIKEEKIERIPGCAVVLTRATHHTSPILIQQVKHNRVLHEDVILMTILPVDRPAVHARERLEIVHLGHGFHRVTAKLGFMQTPDLQTYVRGCVRLGLACAKENVHYFVAYEHVARRMKKPYFPALLWHPFSIMSKTGERLTDFMQVPEDQVFEIGIKVQI